MSLIVVGGLAILSTLALFLTKKKKLETLSLMLWGATIMIFVDKLIPTIVEGEPFFSDENFFLGFLMVLPIFVVWLLTFIYQRKFYRPSS